MDGKSYGLVQGYDISKTVKVETPRSSGGRLNKKDGITRYGNSHVKDKTS